METVRSVDDISETACGHAISLALNHVAATTKIPAAHLALEVPGSCHTHSPTTDVVDGCAYCARNGNCFSGSDGGRGGDGGEDVVADAVEAVSAALRALINRVFDGLDARGVATRKARDAFLSDDLESALMREFM